MIVIIYYLSYDKLLIAMIQITCLLIFL